MIRLESVSRRWGAFTLKNISLEVLEGEYFVVLGPTGTGKTLLLETIAGFHHLDKGKVLLRNNDITFQPPSKRNMGFVYQDYMLFPNMTVANNIAYGMKMKGMKGKEVDDKVNELAELLGIKNILHRYPSKLSGGEAQRTALARALSLKPDILMMDEALSALDPNLRAEIRSELRKLHKQMGTTTIHVTHSREDAMVLGDRIAVMDNGKILQVGTPEEIFQYPNSKFVAEFVGVENIFKGTSETNGGVSTFNSGDLELYTTSKLDGEVHASLRPEDIILSFNKISSSARNCIAGEVQELSDQGAIVRVTVRCSGHPIAVNITRASCVDMNLTIGQEVYLLFKAQNVNLFN
jgi:molybdate/tungstate transport system ATP-binding protein